MRVWCSIKALLQYIYIYIYLYIYIYIYIYTHIYTYIYLYIFLYVFIYLHTNTCYICIYICTHIFCYTHTLRHLINFFKWDSISHPLMPHTHVTHTHTHIIGVSRAIVHNTPSNFWHAFKRPLSRSNEKIKLKKRVISLRRAPAPRPRASTQPLYIDTCT